MEHRERVGHHEVVEGRHEHRDAGGEQGERERNAPRGLPGLGAVTVMSGLRKKLSNDYIVHISNQLIPCQA